MKVILIFLIYSSSLIASPEKAPCRYDLIGLQIPPASFIDKDLMTTAECRKAALESLQANKENYHKVIIKDLKLGKMSVINLNGQEE